MADYLLFQLISISYCELIGKGYKIPSKNVKRCTDVQEFMLRVPE